MKTLLIDNFDSFTYNLFQLCAELGGNPEVFRNNEITLEDIEKRQYTHIIISPGPGTPENPKDFGVCDAVIGKFAGRLPILGVCLGHQGILYHFGAKIGRAPVPVHGKESLLKIDSRSPLFKGLPGQIKAMRYHSLLADRKSLPKDFKVIAETVEDGLIMAVSHKAMPLFGVQFHPESIGTPDGSQIMRNFLAISK